MPIKFILFGNMCSGKTTVGQILKNESGYVVVSAKDVILSNLDSASDDVKMLRTKGALLPDDLVMSWYFSEVDAQLEKGKPVILDGFPRTEMQARQLMQEYGDLGKMVYLDFDMDVLRRRFDNRIMCDTCEMPYSRLFSDFDYECLYCGNHEFSPRPTDRPDYFDVKTSQFNSISMRLLPLLQSAGLEFVTLQDHSRFAGLRKEVITKLAKGAGYGD